MTLTTGSSYIVDDVKQIRTESDRHEPHQKRCTGTVRNNITGGLKSTLRNPQPSSLVSDAVHILHCHLCLDFSQVHLITTTSTDRILTSKTLTAT